MLDSPSVTESRTCFQFKTSFSPCIIMQLNRYQLNELENQLPATISRAPNFFMGSPIVIDLETLGSHADAIDFKALKSVLINNNLVPVGVRGGSAEQHTAAVTAGIPVITIGKSKSTVPESPSQDTPQDLPKAVPSSNTVTTAIRSQRTKLITTPIRSGMQVYAKDADLIVVAPVSAGAELLADGNIHVYGPLRGRALAGVQGDVNARIFCCSLAAELVAIAGYYLVKEDMQTASKPEALVQIYLENEDVKISNI